MRVWKCEDILILKSSSDDEESQLSGLVCSDFIGFRVLLLFEACVIGEQEQRQRQVQAGG